MISYMKHLLILCSLVISFVTFAQSDSQTFVFDGSDLSKSVSLSDSVYRTEYRNEQRATVCYRNVIVRHDRVCRSVQTGTVCSTVNGQRVCRPTYTQQCHSTPVYVRQAYTCYQTVTVAYQVLDHYINANVRLNFSEVPAGVIAQERITLNLNDDRLTSRVNSSGNVALLYTKKETSRMEGRNVIKDVTFNVQVVDLQKALLPIKAKIELVSASSDELVLEAGEIPADLSYTYSLELKKKNNALYDGMVPNNAIEIEALNGRSIIKIKLDKIRLALANGKYKAKFSIALSLPSGGVLNTDIPNLESKLLRKAFKVQ